MDIYRSTGSQRVTWSSVRSIRAQGPRTRAGSQNCTCEDAQAAPLNPEPELPHVRKEDAPHHTHWPGGSKGVMRASAGSTHLADGPSTSLRIQVDLPGFPVDLQYHLPCHMNTHHDTDASNENTADTVGYSDDEAEARI